MYYKFESNTNLCWVKGFLKNVETQNVTFLFSFSKSSTNTIQGDWDFHPAVRVGFVVNLDGTVAFFGPLKSFYANSTRQSFSATALRDPSKYFKTCRSRLSAPIYFHCAAAARSRTILINSPGSSEGNAISRDARRPKGNLWRKRDK